MTGPLKGIIVGTDDPNGMGRVRVSFPSLGDGVTVWAPVVQSFVASDAGQPSDGDLVLVVFENHDMHLPIVIGRLPSVKDRARRPAPRAPRPAPAPPPSRSGSR